MPNVPQSHPPRAHWQRRSHEANGPFGPATSDSRARDHPRRLDVYCAGAGLTKESCGSKSSKAGYSDPGDCHP